MKKFIALILALVLLSLGAVIAVAASVNKNKDTLTHSERTIWGDPAFAEGAEVKSISHYQNHLVWESLYTVGEGTKTDFKFHFGKHYTNSRPRLSGFILDSDIDFGFNLSLPASEQQGLAKVYKELYDSLDYDEMGEKNICLADYYDYYPLSITINLPTLVWNARSDSFSSGRVISNVNTQNDKEIYDDFCEFFKIPVLDTEYVDITVTKHRRPNSVGFGHGWSDNSTDIYSLHSHATYTDKVCYIYVNNRTENGNIMDFSNVPGGYGIYALPYEGAKLKTGELAMVYALDEKSRVSYMTVNEDYTRLLLTVVEDGASYFEVIDIATMTRLQKFKINDGTHYIVYPNEDFVAYEFEKHIAVIEEKGGLYSLAFVTDKFFDDHTDTEYFYFRSGAALDFDGERLIVVDNLYFTGGWQDMCGFFMAVYDKNGLQYFGEYSSSLDANYDASTQYSFHCRPLGYFDVRWNGK